MAGAEHRPRKGREVTVPDLEGRLAGRGQPAIEARRRRTFAVISHPDAGKSTLTEALALHAHAITEAGAVHGKPGRRGVVSDWMEMEQARGISITSAALQFSYHDTVINLLDTPGHADFSEDTYRVLAAVDCAVMLLDAAKGLEPQTLKLFQVCRYRAIPIITVINKWDQPAREPLELIDEIATTIRLRPTPLTWPVGHAGDFRGVLDRRTGTFVRFTRTAGGATLAPQQNLTAEQATAEEGAAWATAVEESDLLAATGSDHDQSDFLAGRSTPVLFTSAVLNFGVGQLLDVLLELAPPPTPRRDAGGTPRPLDADFSGFVFKIQAGMDPGHRDRLAFIRICSGIFERGMIITHARTGRPLTTKYAQQVFGRKRNTIDLAYPGDVVGLINAHSLRVGDSLYADTPAAFPPIPSFAPEHFVVARADNTDRHKQFRHGIDQLDQERVVQVLRSDKRGEAAPVLAAVGPLQFQVAAHRLQHEFNSPTTLEVLAYKLARRTDHRHVETLNCQPGVEVLRRSDGELLAVFADRWSLQSVQRAHPQLRLEPLIADDDTPP